MSWATHVREAANAKRAEIGISSTEPATSDRLCALLEQSTGITPFPMPHGDSLLGGAIGVLDSLSNVIWLDGSLEPAIRNATCVHEFGHFFLHFDEHSCGNLDVAVSSAYAESGIAVVDGYSPQQRKEMEANVFAAEFLLPQELARELFVNQGLSADDIADKLNLTIGHVCSQLADSLLTDIAPLGGEKTNTGDGLPNPRLDKSQLEAAHASHGPVLVGAGPGTGKTTCLIERCRYLIKDHGVSPQNILLLTFSRKAAQEMRDRYRAAQIADDQASPWIGTFHSFGLEVLRRFGDRLGLKQDFIVLSPDECDTVLENNLIALKLDVLDHPEFPARNIPAIRSEISRAKGERCSVEAYKQAASQAEEQHRSKLLEVAHCYQVYEQQLTNLNAVDYDDLIVRPVELLEKHLDAAEILRRDFPHVLADEYQDVNAATAQLLRRLAGDQAKGLWVVGDERQTIYRFRGASPANIENFHTDYPRGQRFELTRNYRSAPGIVSLAQQSVNAFGMVTKGEGSAKWDPVRDDNGGTAVEWYSAENELAQIDNIADIVVKSGKGDYSRFAVLCRNHKKASYIADHLAVREIPAVHIGELLDYPVVRDLLSIMSASSTKASPSVLRAGSLPIYSVPRAELQKMAVEGAVRTESLSDQGSKFAAELQILSEHSWSPAALLDQILWNVPQFSRTLLSPSGNRVDHLENRLAVSHLRGLAGSFEFKTIWPNRTSESPVDSFIDYLGRQRESGNSPRGREPDSMAGANVVRVMTIHAAKGLEFSTVFVPYLQVRQFPPTTYPSLIPTNWMENGVEDQKLAEEQCLFFVAMTRARDRLILSRVAKQDSGRNISPSPLLRSLSPWLSEKAGPEATWRRLPAHAAKLQFSPPAISTQFKFSPPKTADANDKALSFSLSELDNYLVCPKRYEYNRELAYLEDKPRGTTYKFHSCLRSALSELRQHRANGQKINSDGAVAVFDKHWNDRSLSGDLHEAYFRDKADRMLNNFISETRHNCRLLRETTLTTNVGGFQFRFRPDAIYYDRNSREFVLVSQRTGKPDGSDLSKPKFAVWRNAGSGKHENVRIEIDYLAIGEIVVVQQDRAVEEKNIASYVDAAKNIAEKKFEPNIGDCCRYCAHWLICPA